MKKMYENIGEKIKALAKILFIIEIFVTVIGGIILSITFINVLYLRGFSVFFCFVIVFVGTVVIGVPVAYISSMFFYGFGELISNSKKLVEIGNAPQEVNSNKTSTNISAEQ